MISLRSNSAALAALLSSVAIAPALAQTAPVQLETTTVTARRIAEPIEDVPFGITALSRRELRDAQIETSRDLARWVPNFQFSDTGLPFASLLSIRGIGSSSALIAPSVTYYLDGIPIPARVADQRFLDVARIEVLRGPQGTLFGLNSQAGALNITTVDPGPVRSGEIGVEYGSFGRKQLTATAGGPVNEKVAARVAAQIFDYDGDIRNFLFSSPTTVSSIDRTLRAETTGTVRGKLDITPDDDTLVRIAAYHQKTRQNPSTGLLLSDRDYPRNAFNPLPTINVDQTGLGVTVERDLGFAKLTSISGYHRYGVGLSADIVDGFIFNAQTGFPPIRVQAPGVNVRTVSETNTQATQEVRLAGVAPNGTKWVAGAFALYSDFDSTTDIVSAALSNGAYTGRIKTTNTAGFGEATVPITERLRLIGGLRYTYERKGFDGVFAGRPGGVGAVPFFSESADPTFAFLTGRTGLSFDITSDLTAFGTVARGVKPGGYLFYNQLAARAVPLREYASVSTWSYEAGFRGRPFVDWIDVGVSVFYNDTTNEQLFTFNPVLARFDVLNADTVTYGAELEVKARPVSGLVVGGNLGLLHAKITGATSNPALVGNTVPYAPSINTGLFGELRVPAPLGTFAGEGFLRLEYQHVGRRQIDPANSRWLDPYNLVNMRAGLSNKSVDAYVFVNNLLNEAYELSGFQAGATTITNPPVGRQVFAGIPGLPRTFGFGMRLRF